MGTKILVVLALILSPSISNAMQGDLCKNDCDCGKGYVCKAYGPGEFDHKCTFTNSQSDPCKQPTTPTTKVNVVKCSWELSSTAPGSGGVVKGTGQQTVKAQAKTADGKTVAPAFDVTLSWHGRVHKGRRYQDAMNNLQKITDGNWGGISGNISGMDFDVHLSTKTFKGPNGLTKCAEYYTITVDGSGAKLPR